MPGPAFANGSIEAWAIWDPYFAIGEKRQNGRILVNAYEVAKTNSFYLANRDFANANVQHTRDVIDGSGGGGAMGGGAPRRGRGSRWPRSPAFRSRSRPSRPTARRSRSVRSPTTSSRPSRPSPIASHKLGLIPKPIAIRDIVWRPAQT